MEKTHNFHDNKNFNKNVPMTTNLFLAVMPTEIPPEFTVQNLKIATAPDLHTTLEHFSRTLQFFSPFSTSSSCILSSSPFLVLVRNFQ